MPRISKTEKAEALARIADNLPEGQRVFAICRRRATSGMSHCYTFHVISEGDILSLTYNIALALGLSVVKVEGQDTIRIAGCGFNKAAHVVTALAKDLHGNPRALVSEYL